VKVEQPGRGDPGRMTEGGGRDSLYFLSFNHNKQSVAIDLASKAGKELFLSLVPKFDIVTENFTLGTMEKLGIGYDLLREIHPGLIYGTIKGFGTYGPYSQYKCFDWVAQAMGGAFSVTGEADGPPTKPGATVADTGSGMHLAMGILAAYIQRERTGRGQMIEIAMQETITNFMRMPMSLRNRFPDGPVPRRGSRASGMPATGMYPCAPGGSNDYIYMHIVTERMWDSLCIGIGKPEMGVDERFNSIQARAVNWDAIQIAVSEWTMQHTKFEAMELLAECGVPCGAVYDSVDILNDKHLAARNQVRTIHHPVLGDIEMMAPPIHMSDSDVEMTAAPLLGADTADVLARELGLSQSELQKLADQGVLGLGPAVPAVTS
ncbi:MAG: CoA transferase, partial [Tepidiformaceae bacterium]